MLKKQYQWTVQVVESSNVELSPINNQLQVSFWYTLCLFGNTLKTAPIPADEFMKHSIRR